MNTHENIEELADLATAGAWEPDAHATSCGSCAAAIADARAFQRWTSGLLSPDAPPSDLEDRLIAAFRATGTAAARRFRLLPGKRFLKWAAGVAAVVGVVALGGAFAPSDGLSLKTLASAEADFRGNEAPDFWAENGYAGYLGLPTKGGVAVDGKRLSEELAQRGLGVGQEGVRYYRNSPSLHRYGGSRDFKVADPTNPSFAVETEGRPERLELEMVPTDLRIDGSHRLGLTSPTAGGAGPLAGATFSLDSGVIQEPTGEIASGNLAFAGRQLQNAPVDTFLTKLESDVQVHVRQGEVKLAQVQELSQKLDEARAKLGKAVAEKATTVAEVEYARKQSEDLSEELSRLEDKSSKGWRYKTARLQDSGVAGKLPSIFNVESNVAVPGAPITDALAVKPTLNDFPGVDTKLAQDNRKLIRTAKLAVEVDTYEAAQTKVAAAAAEEKGYVASADTERLQNGKIRATVTLRVPPERFEALLGKLRMLGTVKHQTLATDDVGKSYFDMEARMGAKQALLDRLKKVLAEAKGSVKELMDVEVQMGATLEQIEALKGELKYLDNQVSLATITLELAEKDLGQPFEYVQTLQSRIGLVTSDVDAAYAAAQKAVVDAGGQVVDSKMTRQNDGAATGTIRARVEAAKFPDVRQALRALGHVETDTVDQQKTARGGAPTASAPVRVEQATIDLSVSTPALLITRRAQVVVEAKAVDAAYAAARQAVEAAGGRILDGGLSSRTDGGSASLKVQVDVAKFAGLVDLFRASGEVKHAVVNQSAGVLAVPVRERAEVELILRSPPALIGEEQGLGRIVRDTFARSWGGLLWSVEKLFVGLSLAGPWALAVVIGWLLWRRYRRVNSNAARQS